MKKKTMLISFLLVLFIPGTASATIYDFLDSLDTNNTKIIHGFYEDDLVFDKIYEFMNTFNITNIENDTYYVPYQESDLIIVGTFSVNKYIVEKFGSVWPLSVSDANGFVHYEIFEGRKKLVITGDEVNSTIDAIEFCIDYKSHASNLSRDFIMLSNGSQVNPEGTCTSDSDNGNFAVAGVLIPGDFSDRCISPSELREFSCTNGILTIEDVDCECDQGACKPTLLNILKLIDEWIWGRIDMAELTGFMNLWSSS